MDPSTAQAALVAYQRMGADLEGQERFAQAAVAYSNAATSARALGRLQDALETSQKAVEMAERAGDPRHLAPALVRLGQTHMDLNAPHRAIPIFEKATRYARESSNPTAEAGSDIWLSRAYRRLGKLDLAKGSTQKAMEFGKQIRATHVMAQAWQGLGRVAAAKSDFPTAASHLQEALRLSQHPSFVETTQKILGGVYREMGKLPEAEVILREAVAGIEDIRSQLQSEEHREAFVEDKIGAYAQLKAREAYTAFLARVRAQSREQASLMTVEPLTLSEVQALLGPEAVLLEYFVGGGRTLLWAITRDSLRAVRLRIGENDLTRRVSEFRDLISSRGRADELQQAGIDLFGTLLAPAFPGGLPRELIIVPHRVLHYLPFHALMPTPGRYLLQDSLVSYLSSASLLQFTREKQRAAPPAALAVGNPDLEDPTLNLRYAEREVREVERLFPRVTVLVRKDATKGQTRRRLDAQSLIHLATHADLDEQDPLGSALLLRPEAGDTGRLEVQEIFGLDLHADLVILSACDTSLGKLTQGDEVVGLTRGFIYAGTPSVISTLWRVDDRASYELMRAFYENLRAGQPKGEALRQAQLAILQRYPHPYYWAAYQLTGEPR
jgi:CHAT domain-containing protein